MLDKIRQRAKRLYENNKDNTLKCIIDILEYDNCFFEMSPEIAVNILYDLGFNEDEAKKIYIKLIDNKNYKENI